MVARDQAEGKVCRHITTRGHSGEVGKCALVALGCGAFQPTNGLCAVAGGARTFEVLEPQQVLGRRVTLHRHGEQNRLSLRAGVRRRREPVGHRGAALDILVDGR